MRKIDPIYPLPDSLDLTSDENKKNRLENIRRIVFNKGPKKAKLSFKGYERNKEAIGKLNDGCCAYCGSRIDDNETVEVEHYRPKNELKFRKNELCPEGLDKPEDQRRGKFDLLKNPENYGYFVWGDDGYNLLPACGACNSGRGKNGVFIAKKIDGKVYQSNIEKGIPYGKRNFFPIAYDKRNKKNGLLDHRQNKKFVHSIVGEFPLLFNPLKDDPDYLFVYKDEFFANDSLGQFIKVRPNPRASRIDRLKATVSINLLGLNREALCIQRYGRKNSVNKLVRELAFLKINHPGDIVKWARLCRDFSTELNPKVASFPGYSERVALKPLLTLRKLVIGYFPVEAAKSISNSEEYKDILEDISCFSQLVNQEKGVDAISDAEIKAAMESLGL